MKNIKNITITSSAEALGAPRTRLKPPL